MFTLLFLFCLFIVLFSFTCGIGLVGISIGLFIIGCCNLWRAKWLEPTDFVDNNHMERTKKKIESKATIQIVIGIIMFAILMA